VAALCIARPASALDPRLGVSQYVCDAWTARDGAPASTIRQITQTPDGYLWLATHSEGLVRFDGVRFERVR
jgi:ligand-binding sensor domain-containing protein